MKIVNEPRKIEILPLVVVGGEEGEKKHGPLFPNSISGLIIALSGGGKTCAIISISPNGLKFANLYIYSKSRHQAKYRYLEKIMAGVEESIGYHTFSNN